MLLKDVIRADKVVTDWGEWASGKMPRTAFPLSRSRQNFYRLGSYRWRIIQFEALGETFRVLVCLHEDKEQYRAFLGMDCGQDTKLISTYEFHGTHPGWHSLMTHKPLDQVPGGIRKGPWQSRVPSARNWHRRRAFGVAEQTAADIACEFFGLPVEKKQLDMLDVL
jgi:hypothetical protein